MLPALISRVISLTLGTLYPAYASYKAVRTKNVKEYVRWMMYWIVFALFTSAETFADVFLSFWFPFYYELKIITLMWLLLPQTNGSSVLYKQFVHPALLKREQEIDSLLEEAKTRGYSTILQLGVRGARYLSSLLMEGVVRGPTMLAELVQTGQLAIEQRIEDDRRMEDVTDLAPAPVAGSSRSGASDSTKSKKAGSSKAGAKATEAMMMDIDLSDTDLTNNIETEHLSESDFALDSDSEKKGRKGARGQGDAKGKAKRGRKSKKTTSTPDLTLSSGEEMSDPDFDPSPKKKTPRKSSRKTRGSK